MTKISSLSSGSREVLNRLYAAAIAAAAPGPALKSALHEAGVPTRPIWILALGKAAAPMANAATESLHLCNLEPAGGLVIAPSPELAPHPNLTMAVGDHPLPGPGSFAAAKLIASTIAKIPHNAEVWVLLSGGATSLIAGPESGIAPPDLAALYDLLLGSGLDITAMNRIRKRFSQWGGGKLAAALSPRVVRCFIVSDVIGDDLASIGSGPCVADTSFAADIRNELTSAGLFNRIPVALRDFLTAVESNRLPETPKPDNPVFSNVQTKIIVSNRLALEAAVSCARESGLDARLMDETLSGEASDAGVRLAEFLFRQHTSDKPAVFVWGGETTVTLGDNPSGLGGRCQELALAAAKCMSKCGASGVTLLAAGTDGRDGPTDAAGAVVNGFTWELARQKGRDPEEDLKTHNSYDALDSAGALLRPGLTGTNVMDIVIGHIQPD